MWFCNRNYGMLAGRSQGMRWRGDGVLADLAGIDVSWLPQRPK
ncbi:hypothetical protein DVDV_4205 [Desulfovibrio sp. DV]|nr:hypothetical protein DVDV_4205 [Desulfovibrio sp. DV]